MYKGKSILCVVPARGGSKGVPLKNMREFMGVPLITRAGEVASKVDFLDSRIVSTDHRGIAELAKKSGLDVPFYRPENISGDFISDYEVLSHAHNFMERKDNKIYDIIVMLQPTSPLRKVSHIVESIKILVDTGADSVVTVSQVDLKYHPLKQFRLNKGKLEYFAEYGKKIIARQQLQPTFIRNGVAYAMTRSCLVEQKKVLGEKIFPLIINDQTANIDTEDDFVIESSLTQVFR